MPKSRMISALSVCFILIALLASLGPACAQGAVVWSMLGHDPQHTGLSLSVGPATANLKWRFPTQDWWGGSSPVIGPDGTIYAGSDDYIYAINPDGTERWEFYTGCPPWSYPAIGSDGTIYVPADPKLYALGPDGSLKWQFDNVYSSPVISSDDTVYVIEEGAKLCALDSSGHKKWEAGKNIVSAPLIGLDGTLYSASNEGIVHAINPDGSEKWEIEDCGHPAAIGSDGTIYIRYDGQHDVYGQYNASLRALNPDGSKKWEIPMPGYGEPLSIGRDGTIICCTANDSGGASLIGLNPDGSRKWECPDAHDWPYFTVIDGDGTTYVSSYDSLYAVSSTGSLKWRVGANGGLAIGSDGTLYAAAYGGLLAFGPGQTPAPPSVSISEPSATGTNGFPVTYTITYTNATAVTLSPADVNLNATGNVTGTVSVSGSGATTRIVRISNISGDGTLSLSLQAGTASNTAGGAVAAGPGKVFEVSSARIGQGDWFMSGHDARHTACGGYAGPALPMEKWECDLMTSGISQGVTDSAGTIYIASFDGFDAVSPNGAIQWHCYLDTYNGHTPAIGPSGTLYAATDSGKLCCISPTGKIWWSRSLSDGDLSEPVVGSDGTIYVGMSYGDATLYAVNPDGALRWSFGPTDGSFGTPVIGPDGTLFGGACQGNKLYAVSPNGREKWEFTTAGPITSPPSVAADGTVYIGTDDRLYAINPNGRKKWQFITPDSVRTCPAIGPDGTIYVGSDKLYALDSNGARKWDFSIGPNTTPATIDSQGTIYVGTNSGDLYAINPDGSQKWKIYVPGGVRSVGAIAADCTLYVCSEYAMLYAFAPDRSTVPPSLSISGPNSSWYNPRYTITYHGASQFTLSSSDVILNKTGSANAAIEVDYAKPGSYIVMLEDPTGNGTLGISIRAGSARNAAGLAPAVGPSKTFRVANPPTVAISAPSAYSTRQGPVSYTLSYQDATRITLKAADVVLQTTGSAKGSVSVTGSGNLARKITISRISGEGTMSVHVSARTCSNASGPDRDELSGESFAVRTPPTITVDPPWDNATATGPIDYYVSYSNADKVTLSLKNIILMRTGTANGVVSLTADGPLRRRVTISNIVGDGSLAIFILPATASNSNGYAPAVKSDSVYVVNHPPRITISSPSQTSTKAGPVRYVVTYAGADGIWLSESDIHLNTTGTAAGTVSVTQTSPETQTVTISNIKGDGTLGISIREGTAENWAGYSSPAGPSATFAVANTPPKVQISQPSVPSTKSGPVTYAVTYTNTTSVSLSSAKVHLDKTGTASGRVAVTGSGTSTRMVTISQIKGSGTLRISIDARTASNALGYAPSAGPSAALAVLGSR